MSSDPSFEEQEALKHTVSSLEELRLKEQLQVSERELEELELTQLRLLRVRHPIGERRQKAREFEAFQHGLE